MLMTITLHSTHPTLQYTPQHHQYHHHHHHIIIIIIINIIMTIIIIITLLLLVRWHTGRIVLLRYPCDCPG
jgi:hypothetical protein